MCLAELRTRAGFLLALSWIVGATLFASSDLQNSDPSQWSDDDVYRILHDSPWTKTAKMSSSGKGSGSLGESSGNAGNAPVSTPVNPAPTGRMGGRRGMGGQGTYSSTSGRSTGGNNSKSIPEEITIQWQSALPVRLAAAKNAGEPANVESAGPADSYVVAVIGLPLAYFGGRAASADSDSTTNEQVTERVQEELKKSASLVRSHGGHLNPTKVELDQGKDGRTLFYFSKQDPITIKDKTVEFRISNGQASVHKAFVLKEMMYRNQLQL